MSKSKNKKVDPEKLKMLSPVEALRIENTDYTQDEFIVHCGFIRSTYYRWIAGQSEARITLAQVKKMAQLLGIERIDQLPDDFSRPRGRSTETPNIKDKET